MIIRSIISRTCLIHRMSLYSCDHEHFPSPFFSFRFTLVRVCLIFVSSVHRMLSWNYTDFYWCLTEAYLQSLIFSGEVFLWVLIVTDTKLSCIVTTIVFCGQEYKSYTFCLKIIYNPCDLWPSILYVLSNHQSYGLVSTVSNDWCL